MTDLEIINYSEKSFVVRGNTKDHKEDLKSLGGKWNSNLRDGGGWIFSNTKLPAFKTWQESGKITNTNSYQSFQNNNNNSNTDLMLKTILSKVTNLDILHKKLDDICIRLEKLEKTVHQGNDEFIQTESEPEESESEEEEVKPLTRLLKQNRENRHK